LRSKEWFRRCRRRQVQARPRANQLTRYLGKEAWVLGFSRTCSSPRESFRRSHRQSMQAEAQQVAAAPARELYSRFAQEPEFQLCFVPCALLSNVLGLENRLANAAANQCQLNLQQLLELGLLGLAYCFRDNQNLILVEFHFRLLLVW